MKVKNISPKLSARANQMLIAVPILKHEPGTDLELSIRTNLFLVVFCLGEFDKINSPV